MLYWDKPVELLYSLSSWVTEDGPLFNVYLVVTQIDCQFYTEMPEKTWEAQERSYWTSCINNLFFPDHDHAKCFKNYNCKDSLLIWMLLVVECLRPLSFSMRLFLPTIVESVMNEGAGIKYSLGGTIKRLEEPPLRIHACLQIKYL